MDLSDAFAYPTLDDIPSSLFFDDHLTHKQRPMYTQEEVDAIVKDITDQQLKIVQHYVNQMREMQHNHSAELSRYTGGWK